MKINTKFNQIIFIALILGMTAVVSCTKESDGRKLTAFTVTPLSNTVPATVEVKYSYELQNSSILINFKAPGADSLCFDQRISNLHGTTVSETCM